MKKMNRNSEEYFDALINFELEKYGMTVAKLKEEHPDGKIDGVEWFQHYTFDSADEWRAWKKRCRDFTLKECTPRMSAPYFERAWPMFNLSYGLKYNFPLDDLK
jgi:hypothetical protein